MVLPHQAQPRGESGGVLRMFMSGEERSAGYFLQWAVQGGEEKEQDFVAAAGGSPGVGVSGPAKTAHRRVLGGCGSAAARQAARVAYVVAAKICIMQYM